MSGLVGLYYTDGRRIESSLMDKMTTALAHRGLDGSGLWQDGHIGLGHRMRWTTPESLEEHLPLFDPVRRLAITADARLDNRDELYDALNVPDCSIPDSSLILLAYDRWGEACPERLLGDFAFVIWDGRSRALFCARDHLGVKPFYYHHQPGRVFACASEIKALLCLPEAPRRVNESRAGDCFALLFEDKATTFYQDMVRLPPGHRLTVDVNGARAEPYWSFDPNHSLEGLSDEEYTHQFRALFAEAVRARMRSAFPIGSMLSGGLDSSSVTCTARDIWTAQGRGPLQTFSLVFDEVPSCDERRYIQTVVEQGDITPHWISGDQLSPLHDFERSLSYEDEPYLVPNLFLFRAVHEAAAAKKVRVLLDGVDGDIAVFHGETFLTDLVRAGRLISVWRELRGIARNGRMPWHRACRSHVVNPLIPDWVRRAYRKMPGRCPAPNFETVMRSLIRQDFSKRIQLQDRIQASEVARKRTNAMRETHWRQLTHGWVVLGLEAADRAAQRLGIEPRHPFFDKRLLEFSLALPPNQKLSKGWTRVILRRAMEGILPKQIQWRRDKANFSPNFSHSLLVRGRGSIENGIRVCAPVLDEYVDVGKLQEVYERSLTKSNKVDVTALWYAMTIGTWLVRQRALHPTSQISSGL